MDIRSAMDRIVAIQGGLAITSPVALTVKRAYKYPPPMSVALPDTPAFINAWTMSREDRAVSLRIQLYSVHMQLFVEDADLDRGADIATAFHVALVDAFDADVTLASTVTQQSLRGGDPTLGILERAGRAYVGLDLWLDLELKESKQFS